MSTTSRVPLIVIVPMLLGGVVAVVLGGTYTDRLSDHRGFYLVRVGDRVTPASLQSFRRPRRAVLVVLDGLGIEEARQMETLQALSGRGQCRRTHVGPLSVSRPLYAVFSTGLEQDRTGSRNNDDTSPLFAESIWHVAREAGLSVSAISELPWWGQLFPRDFGDYRVRPEREDYFRQALPANLMLIHPLYIDEVGHDFGAGSGRYREAVARADRELHAFVAGLDLHQDLLIVTADHGHALRGGHGGLQERVANVLTCYAGAGIRPDPHPGPMKATSVGPSLALLLGLRFPAHMRAGNDDADDGLDVLWQIADPRALPSAYLQDRQQAVGRFREENRLRLTTWLAQDWYETKAEVPTWRTFYGRRHKWQGRGCLLVLCVALVLLLLCSDPRRGFRQLLFGASWTCAVFLATYALQVVLRGGFDPTSINQRLPFIRFTLILGLLVGIGAGLVHLLLRRRPLALLLDTTGLVVAAIVLNLGHPAVLGWTLRFPIPRPELIFFPYFAAIFLAVQSGLGVLLCLGLLASEKFGARKSRLGHGL